MVISKFKESKRKFKKYLLIIKLVQKLLDPFSPTGPLRRGGSVKYTYLPYFGLFLKNFPRPF